MGRKRSAAEATKVDRNGQKSAQLETTSVAPMGMDPGLPPGGVLAIPGMQAILGMPGVPTSASADASAGVPGAYSKCGAPVPPGIPMPVVPKMAGVPQLPGILGKAGMPGMPGLPAKAGMPAPSVQLDHEALVRMRFQQVAFEYEQMKHAGIAPEIAELAEYHGLDDRAKRALDEEMKKRTDTFEADMQALWLGLEGARNPSGLLMLKLKDMRMGTFRGMSALDRTVQDFAKKYRLDAQAAFKLGEVLDKREDPEGDMGKIAKHLERSNKPSSLIMMLLRDLRDGKPVKEPEYAAAIGSKIHERELARTMRRSRSRRRSRSYDRRRDRSRRRSRDRSRNRSRSRGRRRSRSRDRR